jgi:hypothetical protein
MHEKDEHETNALSLQKLYRGLVNLQRLKT